VYYCVTHCITILYYSAKRSREPDIRAKIQFEFNLSMAKIQFEFNLSMDKDRFYIERQKTIKVNEEEFFSVNILRHM